jgi:glycosyltransferase involved in cell wall biosynthesis
LALHRLVFVEQFYFPEGWGGAELPRDLTVHLASRGFDVEVICGSDQYVESEADSIADPATEGVTIRRVPSLFSGKARSRKFLRQMWFYLALFPMLAFRRRPNAYIVQTNPPLALVLLAAAAWVQSCPLIIIAMDIYPEVAEAHGLLPAGSLIHKFLFWIFKWSYSRAQRVVSLGPVMSRRLIAKGVDASRIVEISNWSTGTPGIFRGEQNTLRVKWGLQKRFTLVYSGNLGIGHEFHTLLAGFARARRTVTSLSLVVIGDGSRLTEVRNEALQLGLSESIVFADLLPAAMLPESLGLADLALVTLRPGFEGLMVPSKILSYMSRGVPVLYIGPPSDIDFYLSRCNCGISVRNDDVEGVAREIVSLHADAERRQSLGSQGQCYYDGELSRERGLSKYEALIRSCLTS